MRQNQDSVNILIAPAPFKGSLSAGAAAQAMQAGVSAALPTEAPVLLPVADGGEGTLEALVTATRGKVVAATVTGPLGEPVRARYGVLGDEVTAVIEMAAAAGLPLVPPERRDPRVTTTRGVGELIAAALDAGCRTFIIAIGGSATNDGGAGLAQALGFHLLDSDGKELPPGGAALAMLARIDEKRADPRLPASRFTVACDVENPLTGPEGASAIYGPQKGATPEMVRELDAALANFARIAARDLESDIAQMSGAGAAGGLGGGLVAFLDAQLRRGVQVVFDALDFEERAQHADLILTGEGRIDRQTAYGKALSGVAAVARRFNIPVLAFAGSVDADPDALRDLGITAAYAIVPPFVTEEAALRNAHHLLQDAVERVMKAVALGQRAHLRV